MKKADEIQIIEEFFDIIQNYTENDTVYYDDIQIFYNVLKILDSKNHEIKYLKKEKQLLKSRNTQLSNKLISSISTYEELNKKNKKLNYENEKLLNNLMNIDKLLDNQKQQKKDTNSSNFDERDIIAGICAFMAVLSMIIFLGYLLFWG